MRRECTQCKYKHQRLSVHGVLQGGGLVRGRRKHLRLQADTWGRIVHGRNVFKASLSTVWDKGYQTAGPTHTYLSQILRHDSLISDLTLRDTLPPPAHAPSCYHWDLNACSALRPPLYCRCLPTDGALLPAFPRPLESEIRLRLVQSRSCTMYPTYVCSAVATLRGSLLIGSASRKGTAAAVLGTRSKGSAPRKLRMGRSAGQSRALGD